jgi:hypothetical protein
MPLSTGDKLGPYQILAPPCAGGALYSLLLEAAAPIWVKAVAGPKPSFEAGAPVPLFGAQIVANPRIPVYENDVTADRKRFLADTNAATASAPRRNVVVNWNAGLKK